MLSKTTLLTLLFALFVSACVTPSQPKPTRLRILAYNVKHGRGMDGVVDLERVAAVIREQNADVVTLQEIDNVCGRSGSVDQAKALGALCGMEHAFGAFMEYDGGQYGMALLSRYPIVESANHPLPPGAEPRSVLDARVRLSNGTEVVIAGIHLYRSEEERLAQARAVAEIYEEEQAPVILAGDFNSRREGTVMTLLEASWTNPTKDGSANTFPSDDPDREIDFILVRASNGHRVLRHEVVPERVASDHRPIVMDLELAPH